MQKVNGYVVIACLALALLSLAACAQLGIPQADQFNERVAVGYATVTAVRASATTLLDARKISSADAVNVQQQADTARAGLDIARTLDTTSPAAADAKLQSALTVLTALETYLRSKQ